jgi:predicted DNA-binding protein
MPGVLVQSLVKKTTRDKLDALARARGCSRAAYLRRLVETHVRAVSPRLLRALDALPPESATPRRTR